MANKKQLTTEWQRCWLPGRVRLNEEGQIEYSDALTFNDPVTWPQTMGSEDTRNAFRQLRVGKWGAR